MLILDPFTKQWKDDLTGQVQSWGGVLLPAGSPLIGVPQGTPMSQMTEAQQRALWLLPSLSAQPTAPTAPVFDQEVPSQRMQPGVREEQAILLPAGVLTLAALLTRVPAARHVAIQAAARTLGAGRAAWNRLPGWLQAAILGVGYAAIDLLIPDEYAFPSTFPGGVQPTAPPGALPGALQHITHGANIVGTWVANGVVFYRLADGKLAVVRKNGTVRVWRPKKPIVLYSDGAKDLKTMLKADKALDKQARQLAKVLSRRAPKPSSRRAPRQAATLVEVVNPGRLVGQ